MQLPRFGTGLRELAMLQTQWAQFLNPIISLPILQQNTLTNVSLVSGVNNIDHGLQRKLQGWFLVRKRASADVWDSQDNNPNSQLTLVLHASAPVSVDLVVF